MPDIYDQIVMLYVVKSYLRSMYIYQEKTVNSNNQCQLPAFDFISKSTMMFLIMFVFMSLESKRPLIDKYETNIHYVKQSLMGFIIT